MLKGVFYLENIKLMALFFEGVLSFFSPCIIPIIPIYISILAGEKTYDHQGNVIFNQKNMIKNALFFIIGIAITFFIIAFATSFISIFLNEHIKIIQIFSGILIVFMGLVQVGIFNFALMRKEFSLKQKLKRKKINPLTAILMGFTFSFSWTPCIGPILASVFLYASSHKGLFSAILILVYSLGFILPFLLVAFFTKKISYFFKQHIALLKYTMIISGIILIIIGLSILTGHFQQMMIQYFI